MGNFLNFINQNLVLIYGLIFTIGFFESFFFVSLLLPGTILLILVGVLSVLTSLSLLYSALTVFWAVVLATYLSYFLGKNQAFKQSKLIEKLKNYPNFIKAYQFIDKYQTKSIFLCKFVSPMRAFVPFVAAEKIKFWEFSLYNVLGAFFWASFLLLMGNLFTTVYIITLDYLDKYSLILAFAIVLLALYVMRWVLVKKIRFFID